MKNPPMYLYRRKIVGEMGVREKSSKDRTEMGNSLLKI